MTSHTPLTDLVADRIYYQSDKEEDNNRASKFPMVTFYRLSSTMPKITTKRIDTFQVTAWGTTNHRADQIAQVLIQLLHKRTDQELKNSFVTSINELYDAQEKVSGVALTVSLIMHETGTQ